MKGSAINRLLGSLALAIFLTSTTRAVLIQTVPVGNPGNAADTVVMTTDGTTGYGAVPYNYRIGTYDVTNAQYAEFLNAKASAADPYGLWNMSMDPQFPEGAIYRTGSGPYSYSVKAGYANRPVPSVSWYDTIRFVNWLQNGQGNGDTEGGTYTIIGGGINSGNVIVPDATQRMNWATTNSFHWLLPSENEWYKAAYYNPSSGTYYAYPFQSDSQPAALAPPGNTNSGNFFQAAFNYDGNGDFLTDVGAYPNSMSPFNSFDMGGDVFQWNESAIGTSRGVRGGQWFLQPKVSAASSRNSAFPTVEGNRIGFRVGSVGSVPESTSLVLLATGAIGLLGVGRIKRRRSARR
jgi:sulfatase modifying factor 1